MWSKIISTKTNGEHKEFLVRQLNIGDDDDDDDVGDGDVDDDASPSTAGG